MWVEGGDIHDELLDQLGGVLAPPEDLALTPSAAELEALAAAVAARWPDGRTVPGDAVSSVRPVRPRARRIRRVGSSAWRAGSVAAGLVLFSASAAAAANGGVPLPRPVRVVAYTVGLPVDSPALDETNQHIKQLKEAVKANDKPKAEATVRRLRTDLAKVPASEKKEAAPKVEAAIGAAADKGLIPPPAPTTTTTVPPPSTTATTSAPSTTATTAEEKEKEKASVTTTTTVPATTTTTVESTTSTTAPETDATPSGGSLSGDPGTGSGDPGSGGGDPASSTTTTTTAPETTTTTTTAPETTTTTTDTTTTTMPPSDPGQGSQP